MDFRGRSQNFAELPDFILNLEIISAEIEHHTNETREASMHFVLKFLDYETEQLAYQVPLAFAYKEHAEAKPKYRRSPRIESDTNTEMVVPPESRKKVLYGKKKKGFYLAPKIGFVKSGVYADPIFCGGLSILWDINERTRMGIENSGNDDRNAEYFLVIFQKFVSDRMVFETGGGLITDDESTDSVGDYEDFGVRFAFGYEFPISSHFTLQPRLFSNIPLLGDKEAYTDGFDVNFIYHTRKNDEKYSTITSQRDGKYRIYFVPKIGFGPDAHADDILVSIGGSAGLEIPGFGRIGPEFIWSFGSHRYFGTALFITHELPHKRLSVKYGFGKITNRYTEYYYSNHWWEDDYREEFSNSGFAFKFGLGYEFLFWRHFIVKPEFEIIYGDEDWKRTCGININLGFLL